DRRFDSKTEIPRNYTFTEFSWSDIMSEGLTYNKGSLKVTMDYTDADGNKKTNQPFIDLTAGTKVNAGLVTENNNGFDIKVVKEGVKDLTQPKAYTDSEKAIVKNLIEYLKNGPVEFHFSYSAKVNNNTVVDKPQSNSITFEPGKPDGGGQVKSQEDKITIDKSWKKNNKDVEPAAQDITYYLLKEGKTVASVTVKAGTAEKTVLDAGKGIKFTVGKKLGSGTFSGLEAGATYTVREAVAGYKPDYKGQNTDLLPEGTLAIENNDKPEVKKPTEPKIVFHGKKFVKVDQLKHEDRLFGAEFVVKNKSTDVNNQDKEKFLVIKSADKRVEEIEAVKKAKKALEEKIDAYNKLTAEQQKTQKATYDGEIDKLQEAYNKAVLESRTEYTWEAGTGTNNATPPENAYKLISDGQGRFEITGLSAGNYELVETKAPVGYAKNESPIPFTVKDGTYTTDTSDHAINYKKADAQVRDAFRVDNKKVTIPQTGGIGTIIFTAIGLAIMASAVIAIKKRQATEAR
ncbi:MAG: isopeptide-forming domain-containing fimbrial protein, partial [Finegoldia magna]|nr:isopeptide-forming domain-containing fimbrial protein [Finegoldia magna]